MADLWDESEVISIVDELVRDAPFSLRDTEYASRRELLFQQRIPKIPGIKDLAVTFRSPEIEDDAHAFKNRMLAAPVKIQVAAVSKAGRSQEQAQNLENFNYRHYYRWRDQKVFDPCLFDMASIGLGAVHLSLNSDLLPLIPDYEDGTDTDGYLELAKDELEKFSSGEKQNLFIAEPIDPATLYWSPAKDIVVQAAVVPLSPLVKMYGDRGKQLSVDGEGRVSVATLAPGENVQTGVSTWTKTVTLYTVETAEYCYHVVFDRARDKDGKNTGRMLGVYKNFFGAPAFFLCPAEVTGSSHPLYAYRPLVNGKYQTVPFKNLMTTAMMVAGIEGAQQRYSLEWTGDGPEPDDDTAKHVEVNEDGVVIPPAGYKLVNAGLTLGPDLPRALQTIEAVDKYGYPKALNRPEEVQASSGYDRARQQDAVSSLLDPPLSHFAAMLTDMFKALAHAVKEIGVPITVLNIKAVAGEHSRQKEITLKPSDVADDVDISVGFNSITVFSRIAMQEEGMKLLQGDLLPKTNFFSEYLAVDDVESYEDQIDLDKIKQQARDRALVAVNEVINAIAAGAAQKAIQTAGIETVNETPPALMPTNGEQIRSDRGPSIPIGPGSAVPLTPTPPQQSALSAPQSNNGAGY